MPIRFPTPLRSRSHPLADLDLLRLIGLMGLLLLSTLSATLAAQEEDAEEWTELKGGLAYVDLEVGEGDEVGRRSWVTVYYTGWLEDGTQFDSNRGGSASVFRLGQGQVIRGWERGLVGMRQGGVRKLRVPARFGYGRSGVRGADGEYRIPPGATLLFEIELVGVR